MLRLMITMTSEKQFVLPPLNDSGNQMGEEMSLTELRYDLREISSIAVGFSLSKGSGGAL